MFDALLQFLSLSRNVSGYVAQLWQSSGPFVVKWLTFSTQLFGVNVETVASWVSTRAGTHGSEDFSPNEFTLLRLDVGL